MNRFSTTCGGPSCKRITAANACDTFPDLQVTPYPEPDPRDEAAHKQWREDYQYWSQVRCPCGNGYFCRRHAIWIPGSDVTNGTACPREEELDNYCPASHYPQPAEEEEGAGADEAWPDDQAVLQRDDYSHDAPGTSSSSNRRSSNTREVGRSSDRRPHRRRRSDRDSTATGRSRRSSEYDDPVDYSGSYTQREDQYQSPNPVTGSSTSWTTSSYSTSSTYPSGSSYATSSTYPSSSVYSTSSAYQTWYSSGQASSYNQGNLNDEQAEAATAPTYNADYETRGLSQRMRSMEIREDSYLQDGTHGSTRYQQQQPEEDTVTEDPVEPASQSHR
ncbi:hypothetical protein CEP51_016835, partial [Fusarium floridanum]